MWTDTDFGGCQKTRKSTSGGIIRHGKHIIKSWSTNQAVVALSSGEAEYYGMVKGASGAIGATELCRDLGVEFDGKIKVKTDASAAIGIASRLGVGKVRHIEVNQLWLQEKVYYGKIELIKVKTEENLADVFTKAVDSISLNWHIESVGAWTTKDRHILTPKLDYGKLEEETQEEEEE